MATNYKRRIYCQFCDFWTREPDQMVSHIEKKHPEVIPPTFTPWRFFYYLKTGKKNGSCVMCHKETDWNEKSHKYNRFCNNPACKEKYKSSFNKRMISKYGKVSLIDDPEMQRKMLANRKISGIYVWRDHVHESHYTGSYEKSFLTFLDQVMEYDPNDVLSPSPHTYYYIYEGDQHFYIPDFFIPSLNLEIEIKDGGDNMNMHPKIQEVDKVKERLKDEVMKGNSSSFNYLKIVNMENDKFFKYLEEAKYRTTNNIKGNIIML